MGFLIEYIISEFLGRILKRTTGWNVTKYNELIHNKKEFMFNKYSWFYVLVRMFNFGLLVFSVVGFFFIFFWGIFHNYDYVVTSQHHHIEFLRYNQEYIYDSWSFLLYGLFFYLDLSEIFAELFPLKSNPMLRRNLRSCCHLPFYITLLMTSSLRLILLFTIDKADLVMNVKYAKELLKLHPDSYDLQYGLFIAYCSVVVFGCLIILDCLYVIVFHPRMKKEAIVQCVRPDCWLVKSLHLNPKDIFIESIKDKAQKIEQFNHNLINHFKHDNDDETFHDSEDEYLINHHEITSIKITQNK